MVGDANEAVIHHGICMQTIMAEVCRCAKDFVGFLMFVVSFQSNPRPLLPSVTSAKRKFHSLQEIQGPFGDTCVSETVVYRIIYVAKQQLRYLPRRKT